MLASPLIVVLMCHKLTARHCVSTKDTMRNGLLTLLRERNYRYCNCSVHENNKLNNFHHILKLCAQTERNTKMCYTVHAVKYA
jgi:hypothetical protein